MSAAVAGMVFVLVATSVGRAVSDSVDGMAKVDAAASAAVAVFVVPEIRFAPAAPTSCAAAVSETLLRFTSLAVMPILAVTSSETSVSMGASVKILSRAVAESATAPLTGLLADVVSSAVEEFVTAEAYVVGSPAP
jgi:hypothetical protein